MLSHGGTMFIFGSAFKTITPYHTSHDVTCIISHLLRNRAKILCSHWPYTWRVLGENGTFTAISFFLRCWPLATLQVLTKLTTPQTTVVKTISSIGCKQLTFASCSTFLCHLAVKRNTIRLENWTVILIWLRFDLYVLMILIFVADNPECFQIMVVFDAMGIRNIEG
jgi:hypothetical protein